MKRCAWLIIPFILILSASPALAYLSEIYIPAAAETGNPIMVMIFGNLPDGCYLLGAVETSAADLVATVDINLIYDVPAPGTGCPTALVPYETYPMLVFTEPGLWTVRVVEHNPNQDDGIWEGTIDVTGSVPDDAIAWAAIKACYR